MFRSVGVQVVTYHNEPRQLLRLAEGIAATMAEARAAGVEHVSVVFGDCGEGYIRCSYATSLENIQEAMKRIARFVDKVNK